MEITKVKENGQIETVADIAQTVWREYFPEVIGNGQIEYMLNKFQSFDSIHAQINEGGYEYFMLWENGVPFGYMAVKEDGEKLFLSKLYILKEFRGRGHGKEAFSFLEKRCCQNNIKTLWLTCNKDNRASLAVYDKCGFKIVREQKADIGGGYFMDDYILEKDIEKSTF